MEDYKFLIENIPSQYDWNLKVQAYFFGSEYLFG